MSLESKVNILLDRASLLRSVRSFFHDKGVIEVDTPLLYEYPNLDTHIELITAFDGKHKRYLHSSPEFGMKRLLSVMKKDIYQLSHVFRALEVGKKHNPEFTMIEWYRTDKSLEFLIQECLEVIKLFFPITNYVKVHYYDIFLEVTGIDISKKIDESSLDLFLKKNSIDYPSSINAFDKIDLIFSYFIEPMFQELTVIEGFPHWQKALAKVQISPKGLETRRFEIFYKGVELANGYDELLDTKEQKNRFDEVLKEREALGKPEYAIDSRFLKALEHLPACVGVAMGFDRLMMLRHNVATIESVLPFSWSEI